MYLTKKVEGNLYKKILVSVLCVSPVLSIAMDNVSIYGFGTIGLTYQNNENIIYESNWRMDRGTDGDVSLQNDSKFGLQLDWQIHPKLSFTIQGSVDSAGATLEWANLKYNITDELDIKVGQMRFPTAMYSDILKVSYSYDWVRLPEDVYGILPLTSYQGAELNYQTIYKDIEYHIKFYGGTSKDTMVGTKDVGDYDIELKHTFGVNLALIFDSLEIYTGYTQTDISITNDRINMYFDALYQSDISPIQKDILKDYDPRDKKTKYLSLGFKYNYRNAYLLGEYVDIDMNNIISDNYAWYLTAGYHIDKFTPNITYSKVTGRSNYQVETGNEQIDKDLQEMAERTLTSQEHITLGVRYDIKENIALKAQYDHIKESDKGRGISIHKEEPYEPTDIDLFSLSMDFIF